MIFTHNPVSVVELQDEMVDGRRFYNTPDGKRYPSITTVVSLLSRQGIAKWRQKVGNEEADRIVKKATDRGTLVHELCEKYIKNQELDTDNIDFLKLKKIIDSNVNNVYAQETPLYSHFLETAGRVDLIAEWNGKPAIIDFKTSTKPKLKKYITSYFMQASGYAVMFEELLQISIPNIVIIIAVDGKEPQVFEEKRNNFIWQFIELRKQYKSLYDI